MSKIYLYFSSLFIYGTSGSNLFVLDEVRVEKSCLNPVKLEACDIEWKIRSFGVFDDAYRPLKNCFGSEEFSPEGIRGLQDDLMKYWSSEDAPLSLLAKAWSEDGLCVKKQMSHVHNQYDYFHEAIIKLKLHNLSHVLRRPTQGNFTFKQLSKDLSAKFPFPPIPRCEIREVGQRLSVVTFCFNQDSELAACPSEWRTNCDERLPFIEHFDSISTSTSSLEEETTSKDIAVNSSSRTTDNILLLEITYDPVCSDCIVWNIDKLSMWSPVERRTKKCPSEQNLDITLLYDLLPNLGLYWVSRATTNELKWALDWQHHGLCFYQDDLINTPSGYFSLGLLLFKLSHLMNMTRSVREEVHHTKDDLKSKLAKQLPNSIILNCNIINDDAYLYSVINCFSSSLAPVSCPGQLNGTCHSSVILTSRITSNNSSLAVLILLPTLVILAVLLFLPAHVYSKMKQRRIDFISLVKI